jgi:putative transposase
LGNRPWNRFFEGVLAAHRGTADAAGVNWKAATHQFIQSKIEKGSPMTTLRMCGLGQVSRAGLYRFEPGIEQPDEDLDLRDDIQRIALEFPCYGRPRITAELKRRGWTVNHKRVRRIMREDNLLCLRRRKFVVTTDSKHNLRVYPNLAGEMELTGIDQLWRADITYIRLETEFVYLAVVLDAYSRRMMVSGLPVGVCFANIGLALDRHLEDDLAIAALQMALRRRTPSEGLTHHSDRGVQYASNDYTGLPKEHGVRISMSRSGNPYDNAACESFMKTLKYEEV